MKASNHTKNIMLWSALVVLGVPALAAGTVKVAQGTTQNSTTQNSTSAATQRPALQVRYYSGDPLNGGKLLATKTLQPPAPGSVNTQNTPAQNPLKANAPQGATFAVISDGRGGARIIDLSQADLDFGRGHGRDGRHGGPGRFDGNDRTPDQGTPPATNSTGT